MNSNQQVEPATTNRCSICRQPKLIVKRLDGGTVTGSMMKHRPAVLVCADCAAVNDAHYRESQIRFVNEQITMIDAAIIEHPSMAERFTVTRKEYVRTLAGLEAA